MKLDWMDKAYIFMGILGLCYAMYSFGRIHAMYDYYLYEEDYVCAEDLFA